MPSSETQFKPGNFASLKSGARSPRLLAARSRKLGRMLRPQLRDRSREPLIDLAVRLAAQESLMFEHLQKQAGRGSRTQDNHLRYAGLLLSIYERLGLGQPGDDGDALNVLLGAAS